MVTVSQGEDATLPCASSGFPPPHISWIHDGRTVIRNGERYEIQSSGTLVIKAVDVTDAGNYACTAKNKAGRDSQETMLHVQGIWYQQLLI